MQDRKISWWMPQIGNEEKKFINQVLDNNFPNEGEFTTLFENRIAALIGSKYAVAVTSGTAALFLSLKALGIGPGDEVIVPDITFIATANAVDLCGATTVLVDVEPTRLTMDPLCFKKAITSKTKAVIPVHVSGRGADMQAITEIASAHNIYIVEDAAEALLSLQKGKPLGTFGITGCFSFSPNKTITTGQGGMIVSDNDDIYLHLKELKDQGRPVRGTGGDDLHNSIGYNYKFTDLQAALGLGQLTYLAKRMERMKKLYTIYNNELSGVAGIRILPFDVETGEAPQWTDAVIEKRDALDTYLKLQNIDCRRYWYPLHRQKPYQKPDEGFPISTVASPKSLWLPSAFSLDDSDIIYVCNQIKTFLRG
jgi:perosamine synthetase